MTAPEHRGPAGATRASVPATDRAGDPAAASTGELIGRLTEQISSLVRSEARLAQVEVTRKAKQGMAR